MLNSHAAPIISQETHILVGDIAYRMMEECDSEYGATANHAAYYVAGMLHCEGFRQYCTGISIGLDEVERGFSEMERLAEKSGHRDTLKQGTITVP